MTELRNRMDEAMVLRGFSPRTRESYLACVRALAKHYWQPPDVLDGPRIQAYLLHLITEKKLAYASVNQASCAFRFLFGTVLRKPEMRMDIPMAKVPTRLPQILTRGEVARLIEAAPTFRGRTLLATTYAAGLRADRDQDGATHLLRRAPTQGVAGGVIPPRIHPATRSEWTHRVVSTGALSAITACSARPARRRNWRRRARRSRRHHPIRWWWNRSRPSCTASSATSTCVALTVAVASSCPPRPLRRCRCACCICADRRVCALRYQ